MSDRRAASIEVVQVTKRYGPVTAVRDVSFTIAAGSLVTLLGPSGCGKTTTLRLIAGLETVTSGRILIGGEDVTALGATDRNVSMVFQSYALFPHMSVLDNVAYGPRVAGQPRRQAAESARAALAGVGLAELATGCPASSRAASNSVWPSPARSCSSRACCCSTSRCRTSTRGSGAGCAKRSAPSSSGSGSRWSTSPTTRKRRSASPIASS